MMVFRTALKRTLDYDTIGGLFGDMYLGVHELTVVEKIWAIIIEAVSYTHLTLPTN